MGALPSVKQGLVTGITAVVVFVIVVLVLGVKVWPAISSGLVLSPTLFWFTSAPAATRILTASV